MVDEDKEYRDMLVLDRLLKLEIPEHHLVRWNKMSTDELMNLSIKIQDNMDRLSIESSTVIADYREIQTKLSAYIALRKGELQEENYTILR